VSIADYAESIRLDPHYADSYWGRGVAYAAIGELDKAIADYTEAIRRKPNCAPVYENRALIFESKGNLNKAIADYTNAIRLYPQYIEDSLRRSDSGGGGHDQNENSADDHQTLRRQQAGTYNSLAWILATYPLPEHRNGVKAVEWQRKSGRHGRRSGERGLPVPAGPLPSR